MLKNKILLITISLLSVLFIVIFVYLVKDIQFGYDKKTCFNIPETAFPDHNDSSVLKCIGYIYIKRDNKCNNDVGETKCGDISMVDSKNSPEIVRKVEKYESNNGIIYAIGKLAVDYSYYEDGSKSIFFGSYKNGEEKLFYFNEKEIIPRYIVINSNTLDVDFYSDLSKMPNEASLIFKKLEQK